MKEKTIKVLEDAKLLNILSNALCDLSNKKIKSYIKYKMVEVNGSIATNSNEIIKSGSLVKIYFTKKIITSSKFEGEKLDIIYEDRDLIAIDKPAGLLSISNSKEKDETAFRLVSDYIKRDNKRAKLFVVHRLDQGTSGVLLFAKNLKLKEKLQKEWNELVSLREYIAVVEGVPKDEGTIKSYLTMNHFQIVHSTKIKEIGHLAITHFKVIRTDGKRSLLEVKIDTGRRNQIRVHMSENGHPIVGDKKYGSVDNPLNRLALHASKLKLKDPRNGSVLFLEAPVPDEFYRLVRKH